MNPTPRASHQTLLGPALAAIVLAVHAGPCAASPERGRWRVSTTATDTIPTAFQTTSIAELPDGGIVLSNNADFVHFDGATWRNFTTTPQGGSFSVLPAPDGSVYFPAGSAFGFFLRSTDGLWRFERLAESLPPEDRTAVPPSIAPSCATVDGFYSPLAGKVLFVSHDRRPRVLDVPGLRPAALACSKTHAYGAVDGGGLVALRADDARIQVDTIRGTEALTGSLRAVALADGTVLVLDRQGPIHRWRDDTLAPFAEDRWPEFARALPSNGLQLADGRIAFVFLRGGPLLFEADGTLRERWDESQGIPVTRAHALHEDRDGGVWIAQQHEIVRVDRGSGITEFGRADGLPDAIGVLRHRGELVVSSLSGVYRLRPAPDGGAARFERLREAERDEPLESATDVESRGDWLWVAAGTLQRIRWSPDGRIVDRERFGTARGRWLASSATHADRLYFSSTEGLIVVDDASGAAPRLRTIALPDPAQGRLAEHGADEVWLEQPQRAEVTRVRFGGDDVEIKSYSTGEAGSARPARTGQGLLFAGDVGTLRLDATADRLVPVLDLPEPMRTQRVLTIREDADGGLWHVAFNRPAVARRTSEGWIWDESAFASTGRLGRAFYEFFREGEVLWVARDNGLLRIDFDARHADPPRFAPRIALLTDARTLEDLPIAGHRGDVAYAHRDLQLHFAHSEFTVKPWFRSKLAGFDADWSLWSPDTFRTYTNLPPGEYTFHLEARDGVGRIEMPEPFRLRIAPPWWRTPVAYVGYALVLLGGLAGAALLADRRRRRIESHRRTALEAAVADRTREIGEKNRELAAQAARLREVDALKTRFFTNVGHEFRTPLTLVLGPIDDVLTDSRVRLGERGRELLELANRNARRVLDLIVELLDVNRLEHGQLPLRRVPTDLGALLRRQLAELSPLAERHGHQLVVDGGAEDLVAAVDTTQLGRCVTNLVGNAAKYMARGGTIRVALVRQGDHAEIAVADTGRGIAPELLPHVFDRFFQAQSTETHDGLGIGLSLVREIVELHGGRVGVDSTPGVCSTFRLILPLDAHAAAPASTAPEPPTPLLGAETPSDPAIADGSSERPLAVIIDDHADLRARVRGLLDTRFRTREAADGPQGLAALREEVPDVVVCDVMMPGFDGVELARRMRADPDLAAVPLLLLTAKVGAEHAVAGLSAGADDYLAKPFDAGELLARIDALRAMRRRLRDQLARERTPPVLPEPAVERWRERLDASIAARIDDSSLEVAALAEAAHMDRTSLFRKLKAATGMSPSEYLREARLCRADDLLGQGAGNVTEVAYAVGWESVSSFARAYRARFGRTPSERLVGSHASRDGA